MLVDRRRRAPQGVAVPDAADVLGPRLRVDLRAAGSDQLSRRARPRVRALRRRAGARRVRQSAGGRRPDPGRRRAHADAAVHRARLALPAGGRASVGRARATTRAASSRAARPCGSRRWCRFRAGRRSRRSTRRCWRGWTRGWTRPAMPPARRSACGSPRSSAQFRPRRRRLRRRPRRSRRCRPARLVRLEGAVYSVPCRWAGLDLVVRVGATTVTIVGRDGTPHRASAQALRAAVDRLPALPVRAGAQAAGGAPGPAGAAARSRRRRFRRSGISSTRRTARATPRGSSPRCSGSSTPTAPPSSCPR